MQVKAKIDRLAGVGEGFIQRPGNASHSIGIQEREDLFLLGLRERSRGLMET